MARPISHRWPLARPRAGLCSPHHQRRPLWTKARHPGPRASPRAHSPLLEQMRCRPSAAMMRAAACCLAVRCQRRCLLCCRLLDARHFSFVSYILPSKVNIMHMSRFHCWGDCRGLLVLQCACNTDGTAIFHCCMVVRGMRHNPAAHHFKPHATTGICRRPSTFDRLQSGALNLAPHTCPAQARMQTAMQSCSTLSLLSI